MADDLIPWLRTQLDERERWVLARLEQPGYGAPEIRLLRALQDQLEGTRRRLDLIETKLDGDPGDTMMSWTRMAKIEARQYADRPGYRDEWKI